MGIFTPNWWCGLISGAAISILASLSPAIAADPTCQPIASQFRPEHQAGLPSVTHKTRLVRRRPAGQSQTSWPDQKHWSGYAIAAQTYTSAQATWVVPGVTYAPYLDVIVDEASAAWVGIGKGAADNSWNLIQIGTEQDFTDGAPDYFAWYELLPDDSIPLDSNTCPVSPGDVITASLQCISSCTPNASGQHWHMSMTNATAGWTWSNDVTYQSSLASAEWIVEAPTNEDQNFQPLPYFAPTTFRDVTANNVNPNLSLSANGIIMKDPIGGGAAPSYAVGGNSFTVNYLAEPCKWINSISECFKEYTLPTANSNPAGIAAGPDGALWFTEPGVNKIGRITTTGTITEFAGAGGAPHTITAGQDGALWFTNSSTESGISRINTAGVITTFTLPTGTQPYGITSGPDGALWFAESASNAIGRITTAGVITGNYAIPTASGGPQSITLGPDGALWFTEQNANKVGRVTISGVVTDFPIPTASPQPVGITTGSDGALWFTEYDTNKIGRITTAGVVAESTIPTASSHPEFITAGPDGALWFTEDTGNKIGRITTAGIIAEFSVPTANSHPTSITTGPDGALWFTEFGVNKIGRLIPPVNTASPALVVSPAANMSASGPAGGPFGPSSFDYSLSATSGSVNYSITGIPSWLNASFTSGTATITPVTVTFSLMNVGSLNIGTYSSTISFTNTTNGLGSVTRTVTLSVTDRVPEEACATFQGVPSASPDGEAYASLPSDICARPRYP